MAIGDATPKIILTENEREMMAMYQDIMTNATSLRRQALTQLLNPGLDIYYECHYPIYEGIKTRDYKEMFDRVGVAERVVNILPMECWAMNPEVLENEEGTKTTWEKAWKDFEKEYQIYSYLQRIDILSGIGEYGVLLFGLSDGKDLSEPVDGVNLETGEWTGSGKLELLYLRPFDQSQVSIDVLQQNPTHPRFGFPDLYKIKFKDDSSTATAETTASDTKVHWTRILHVADNRKTSEIYGQPRMRPVYDRILDIRKILSGSGEMFWKGGFPGYSFETQPDQSELTIDTTTLRSQIEDYMGGMQRYLATQGLSVKSLTPQVASPQDHLQAQIDFICITLGVPKRIFTGSERGELASSQDTQAWNKRVDKRREDYVSPFLLEPFINRCMNYGMIEMKEDYQCVWPDLNAPSKKEVAEVAGKRVEALAKYIMGDVETLVPPKEFLSIFMEMEDEEVDAIEKAAMGWQMIEEDDEISMEKRRVDLEREKNPPEPQPIPGQFPPR